MLCNAYSYSPRPQPSIHLPAQSRSASVAVAERVWERREQQQAVEDWDNINKHVASIASSLLHQQICPILIKTLGYSPHPPLFFFHHVSFK